MVQMEVGKGPRWSGDSSCHESTAFLSEFAADS